jgi:hypothetical protein
MGQGFATSENPSDRRDINDCFISLGYRCPMRHALLFCCTLLTACDPVGFGVLNAVNGVSIINMQRTIPDLAVSIASGRDCSIVHLDHDTPYCSEPEQPPIPPPYCTRSLGGGSDCWATPAAPLGHSVADQQIATDRQEADREHSWFRRWVGL